MRWIAEPGPWDCFSMRAGVVRLTSFWDVLTVRVATCILEFLACIA